MKPAADEAATEAAPGAETAMAARDDEPTGTDEEPMMKPTLDEADTEAAPGAATAVAAVESLRKPDDDISELVSGARPVTAPKVDAAPGTDEEPTTKLAGDDVSAESAPRADAAFAAKDDDLPDTGEETMKKPVGDEAATEAAPDAGTAADAKDETFPAPTAAFRGTEETPAPQATLTIRELLEGTIEIGEHDVFYVHAVTSDDYQGLWGILQKGVTENFARGVRLTLDERTDTYRITVPEDADELLEDHSSSPLGLMIHRKSRETIVYNRRLGRLTQDPDVTIFPGNELIIVGFKPEELISLYKHFAGANGG